MIDNFLLLNKEENKTIVIRLSLLLKIIKKKTPIKYPNIVLINPIIK